MDDDVDPGFSAPPAPPPKRRNAVLLLFDAPLNRDWVVWLGGAWFSLYIMGTLTSQQPSRFSPWMDYFFGPLMLVGIFALAPAWIRLQFRRWRWRRLQRSKRSAQSRANNVVPAPEARQDVLGEAPLGLGITASDPTLVGINPSAAMSVPEPLQVKWNAIDADDFERLITRLLRESGSYGRITRLMDVNAADAGRDIQAYRRVDDGLIGERWQRVVVQAKHWPKRGIGASTIAELIYAKLPLWEGEPIQGLIMATTGSFTQDAVRWVDEHNRAAKRPDIVLWSRNEVEILLQKWPHIVEEYGLAR